MDKYEMFDNVKAHSLKVARVADCLFSELSKKLPKNNLPEHELVTAGAMLHDIAKTPCIQEGCRHTELGVKICFDEGFDMLAEIVAEHVVMTDYSSANCHKGLFRAKELVYYSDKRVKHDQVVPLTERLEYIIARYGKGDQAIIDHINENFGMCLDLEKAIFSHLDFSPLELRNKLE